MFGAGSDARAELFFNLFIPAANVFIPAATFDAS
jgi:hypothetical protein